MPERNCPACSTPFLVGGRKGKKLHAKFCSARCHQLSRYHKGRECNVLSAIDAAYLAGFIDGEGTVMLIGRANGTSGLLVTVANTKKPVMDWVAEVTGIGRTFTRPSRQEGHATGYWWQASADAAETFLRQLMPFLRIKHEQAALAMEFQSRLRTPALKADRTWQETYRLRMKALNKRGG